MALPYHDYIGGDAHAGLSGDWSWNYEAELKKKGWQGVWENFARLYSYWATFIINPTFNRPKLAPADATLALQMAQATFQGLLKLGVAYGYQRRDKLPGVPMFMHWLTQVGRPMDRDIHAWYKPSSGDTNNWRNSFGNPRHLPPESSYVVNAKRYFSNQNQPDGPFFMGVHTRGYKNAQLNFISPPTRGRDQEVIVEYAKYKYPPLAWLDVTPYPGSYQTNNYGVSHWKIPNTPNNKMDYASWKAQLHQVSRTPNRTPRWNSLVPVLTTADDYLYYSVEPQDLALKGRGSQGYVLDHHSINYAEVPLNYK